MFFGTQCTYIFKLFHCRIVTPFYYFLHQTVWNIRTGTPLTGASNARGMKKSRFSTNISLYLGNPDFKVTVLFDVKQLENITR